MRKIPLIIVLLFSLTWCQAQKDSIEFSLSTVSSAGKELPEYYLACTITSRFREDITVRDSLDELGMFCLELSPVRIEIDFLDSNCYRNRNPDCSPEYGAFERKYPVKVISSNGTIEYRVRIDPHFVGRINRQEKKVVGFSGAYRLRVGIDYKIRGKLGTSVSKWVYINFD